MYKKRYFYNKETLRFEKAERAFPKNIPWLSAYLAFILMLSIVLRIGFDELATSPKIKYFTERNLNLKNAYKEMEKKIINSEFLLREIQLRDDQVYRSFLELEPIPASVRVAGFGGTKSLAGGILDMPEFDIITRTATQLEKLSTKALIQSWSLKDIYKLAMNQQLLIKCKPSIQPLSPADKYWLSSSFGYRRDPFSGRKRMHSGVDFAGDPGLKVFSTGDGTVTEAKSSHNGYGKEIVVDHGFGYISRYAHLKQIRVKVGQKVQRGEFLGTLGNTGRSTGPHLHYEVLYNNKRVNPMYFYFENITSEEYGKLVSAKNFTDPELSAGMSGTAMK